MRVLIVEDEIMAQKSLIRILSQNFPELNVVGTATSVKGAVSWLKDPANKADIIFMDVELSDGVCFEIFRQVEVTSKVIMTTAYDSYALKAFEAGSIDYLLKPFGLKDITRASEKALSLYELLQLQEKREDQQDLAPHGSSCDAGAAYPGRSW